MLSVQRTIRSATALVVLLAACGDDGSGTDGGAGDDADGDAVADEDDNCPLVANPSQANEDGDLVGDACDPCPIESTGVGDDDADGVGNLCDPNPMTPGDAIVAFDGFAAPTTWTTMGAWTHANGEMLVTASGGIGFPVATTGSETLRMEVVMTAPASTGVVGFAFGDPFDSVTRGVDCQAASGGDPPGSSLSLLDSQVMPSTTVQSVAWPLELATRYRMTLRRAGDAYTCSIDGTSATVSGNVAVTTAVTTMDLFLRGDGRVAWAMVVTSP